LPLLRLWYNKVVHFEARFIVVQFYSMDILGFFSLDFDWSWLDNLGQLPMYQIVWHFLVNGGWALFAAVFIYGAWLNFIFWRQQIYGAKQSFIFLAIDIPKNNLQTPKAVENIFNALSGAHSPADWHEKVFLGEYQLGFSCEIVSIDGFIQFVIRTPKQFRNMVEAAIYSQYPEAEVTEVGDYAAEFNVNFPSDEYNLWGTDMVLTRDDFYPIRTYVEFQEELDKEFKDPMASILEVMNSIGPGEQIWMQLIVVPADIPWTTAGMKEVNKTLGIEEKVKMRAIDYVIEAPLKALSFVGDQFFGSVPVDEKKKDKLNMMFLPPHEKTRVEAILAKIEKTCFKCKLRFLYIGKREVFKKGLGVAGMMGAIRQYSSYALNGFKPGKNKTQAKIMLKQIRLAVKQNKILADYRGRNGDTCNGKYLLNTAELATLFHFPYIEVKAPLIKKIESRRSFAPIGLPVVDSKGPVEEEAPVFDTKAKDTAGAIDYDSDYFEKRFAVDKTGEKDKKRKQEILSKLGAEGKAATSPAKPEKKRQSPPDDSAGQGISLPDNLPFAE